MVGDAVIGEADAVADVGRVFAGRAGQFLFEQADGAVLGAQGVGRFVGAAAGMEAADDLARLGFDGDEGEVLPERGAQGFDLAGMPHAVADEDFRAFFARARL